jgi:hypothetical protein
MEETSEITWPRRKGTRTCCPSSSISSPYARVTHQLRAREIDANEGEGTYFFFEAACSVHASTQCAALNVLMNPGSLDTRHSHQYHLVSEGEKGTDQSSLAIPKSLQHLMRALDLHPSVAVGSPSGLKNVCSPLATLTSLPRLNQYMMSRQRGWEGVPAGGNESPFA